MLEIDLSVCSSVLFSVCLCLSPPIFLPLSLPLILPSLNIFSHPSVCLFLSPSLSPSFHQSMPYPFLCLFVSPSLCTLVSASVRLLSWSLIPIASSASWMQIWSETWLPQPQTITGTAIFASAAQIFTGTWPLSKDISCQLRLTLVWLIGWGASVPKKISTFTMKESLTGIRLYNYYS